MSSSFRRPGKKSFVRPHKQPLTSENSKTTQGPRLGNDLPSSPARATPEQTPISENSSVRSSAGTAVSTPNALKSQIQEPQQRKQHQTSHSWNKLPGTKPWTNNLTLTSFGLREIDSFLFSSGGDGGGQPLGTFVLVEEDRITDDLARTLCRYWCAEGVSQRQKVLMAATRPPLLDSLGRLNQSNCFEEGSGITISDEGSTSEDLYDFINTLPRNLHLDKFRARPGNQQQQSVSNANTTILEEENEGEDEEDHNDQSALKNNTHESGSRSDEGLKIAWQYRKNIQDARSGVNTRSSGSRSSLEDGVYCHSYDLSKRMYDQFIPYDSASSNGQSDNPLVNNIEVVDCSKFSTSARDHRSQGMSLFCCLWHQLQSALISHTQCHQLTQQASVPNTVVRLFLHRLPVGPGSIAMPLLMAKIRKEELPVVVLATIRPWRWISSSSPSMTTPVNSMPHPFDTLTSLRTTSDIALTLDSFPSLRAPPPPEFKNLAGILTLRKCAAFTTSHYTDTIAWKRPLAERFGVKRDGRKMTVQLLHLPPEEFSKGGGSVGSGVRSGGGNVSDKGKKGGCGSSILGGGGSLDF